MKSRLIVFALLFIPFALPPRLSAQATEPTLPRARVTARVVDEGGVPLPDVNVRLAFSSATSRNDIIYVTGLTDANGLFSGEGYSDGGYGTRITKDGFYQSWLAVPKPVDIQDGRWLPWDSVVTTVLRPIGNPVPLCTKQVFTHIPVLDQPCGYDLEVGDWVAPYGKGVTADFIFKIHGEHKGFFDFIADAEVTFVHELDGILPMTSPEVGRYSQFRWERTASEPGYFSSHHIRHAGFPPESGKSFERSFDPDDQYRGYFFRVRTEEREGKLVAANYGKITGDIGIDPRDSKTCSITFTYYFNPKPLDRNLEWDTTRNLIPGLSRQETPRGP